MASPSELFSVKTRICVKEESRYGQGRGIKSREQFRKCLRDVVNIVVRTRNGSGHGKGYSLAVRDLYGIGRLPFFASLIATALPTAKGRWCGCRPIPRRTCPRKTYNGAKWCPTPSPIHHFSTTCGNAHAQFYNATPSLWRKMRQEAYAIDSLFSTCREYIKWLPPDRLLRTYPRFCHRQMRQNFRFYRIFVKYFVHERSVYLGFTVQRE